jgi:NhaP-type Na+/H+ or K+/H+ antiporter
VKNKPEVANGILFYTCMLVLLTLLVNGMTTGIVLKKLGLSNENIVS